MDFPKLLGLRPGVTAVIGSGGKTSLLRRLAEELPGTVLLCTTTHIRPFEEYPLLTAPTPEDIRKALTAHRVLCLGTPCENGKLTAPSLSVETLATLSDYVLVEADGSRQLPLKAHEAHEPVIPAVSRQVICVVGASGFGKPIRESVHRLERFCALTGAAASDPVTPEQAAKAILAERLCDTMFLNRHGDPTVSGGPLRRGAGRLRSPDRRRESSGRERLALPGYLKNMTGPLSPHSAAKPHFLRKSANISTESLIFANVFSCELHKNTVKGFTANWFHGII